MKMLIIAVLSVFVQIGATYAQTIITGVVSDKNTGEALPFTQIKTNLQIKLLKLIFKVNILSKRLKGKIL